MDEQSQRHFDRIASHYQQAADTWDAVYKQVQECVAPLVEGKVVLDVGNGGRFAYDTGRACRVIAMDISPSMLETIEDPRIVKVVGDARNMEGIEDESVDIVIFLFVLHHINGPSVKASLETLDQVLLSARRKLRPGGYLIVTESALPRFVYRVQCLLFRVTRFILARFDVPMIFFFTLPLLQQRIAWLFGLDEGDIETRRLLVKGWTDPLGASFPGLIKVPTWLHPGTSCLIIAARDSRRAERPRASPR